MFAFCLDWNYVGSGGGSMGALFTPLSTQLSLYFGTAICMCVISLAPYAELPPQYHCLHATDSIAFCACYANNVWNGQSYPFLSQQLFFPNGSQFNQLAILNDQFVLDRAKLDEVVRTKSLSH